MKYYIITPEVAAKLCVKHFRSGDNIVGYLVNEQDLGHSVKPGSEGVEEVDKETARQFSLTYR